jgi:hypothetical protein
MQNFDPDFFEDDVVTGDVSWLDHYAPENKKQSMQLASSMDA